MKSEYLSEVQLEQIKAILKKYGIESTDLLEELTDHYAGELEEQIKEGSSFDQAFQEFVSQNSWLKLRKLQYAHWKYSEKSLIKFVKGTLAELYTTYRVILVASVIGFLYFLISKNTVETRTSLVVFHLGLIAQTLFIAVMSFRDYRKHRIMDVGYSFQISVSIFYAMIVSTWSDAFNFFDPSVPAGVGVWIQFGYYVVIAHLAYLHRCLYQRAKLKSRQYKEQSIS
ncbi:MAG: hypothetical protein AAGC47_05290 [Bacteroidota bacterium]